MRIRLPRLIRAVAREAAADGIARHAAALAYFAVFALPGLLVLVMGTAGTLYGPSAVEGRVMQEARSMVGDEGARMLNDMLLDASRPKGSSLVGQVVGLAGLVFGATGFFLHLQGALNAMWGARPPGRRRGVLSVVLQRVLSLAMVLAIAVLLLVSLVLSAWVSAVGDRVSTWVATGAGTLLVTVLHVAVSWLLIAALFAALYKVMPDIHIEWREVVVGAAVTAALFIAGKFAIGTYLGRADPASAYGAAGPLALLLLWIYYSTLVVLLGAEFTQVHARLYGPRHVQRARRMERLAHSKGPVNRRKGPRRALPAPPPARKPTARRRARAPDDRT